MKYFNWLYKRKLKIGQIPQCFDFKKKFIMHQNYVTLRN